MTESVQVTLMDHVRELRGRLFWCVGVFLVSGLAAYFWRGEIIGFLQAPLRQQLYYTSPAGSFNVIMQVCGVIGLLVTLPLLAFHLLRFIEPALRRPLPRRLIAGTVAGSLVLALAGAAFAYYLSLPLALKFFGSVGAGQLEALISVDQYFRFVFTYLAVFAVVFQLPLGLLVADHIFPMGPGGMRKARKYVIVGAFAVALITPTTPDPLSQLVLAAPVILLYEISIIVISIRARGRRVAVPKLTAPSIPAVPAEAPAAPKPYRQAPVSAAVLDLRGAAYQMSRPFHHISANVLDLRVQK